jgi:hypothetical protein
MTAKISLTINFVLLIVCTAFYLNYRSKKVSELERGRESYEEGNFCESLEGFYKGAEFDKNYYKIIAKFYLKGHCVKTNLKQAIIYYGKSKKLDIGKEIFLEGLEMSNNENKSYEKEYLAAIFNESKNLGYQPDALEIEKLNNQDLKKIFKK